MGLPRSLLLPLILLPACDVESDDAAVEIATTTSALGGCAAGAVDDVRYYYPLRDGAEFLDLSYMDVPNGDKFCIDTADGCVQYPQGGVMYDYHRDFSEGSSYDDGIHSTDGFRDYMGNNTTYNRHNGYDNSIQPTRIIAEGGGLVYAMAPGVVTSIVPGAQSTIIVTHANGYKSLYTHLLNGSERIRLNDHVDTSTVLAQLETGGGHLHFALHDCDTTADEPSYFEVYRADMQLLAKKPMYEAQPSDASDVTVSVATAPTSTSADALRFRAGDVLSMRATGQWRTGDTLVIDVVDPSGGYHATNVRQRTDRSRAIWFEALNNYTLPSNQPGWWYVRAIVNGKLGARKYFYVAANALPDVNGPVQSATSMVSSGTDNQRVYYRGSDQGLKSWWWRERQGWVQQAHAVGLLGGPPSCVQRSASLVDCFYRGVDGFLYRWQSTDGGANGTAAAIYSQPGASDPMAFSSGPSSLEVGFSDSGALATLHFDGSSFVKTTNTSYSIASPPSCIAKTATTSLCFARVGNNTIYEYRLTNGLVGFVQSSAQSTSSDVQATMLPGALDQANLVNVTSMTGNAMHRGTRIEYTSGATKWLATQDAGILAAELSTPARCGVRPGSTTEECYAADKDHNLIRTAWTGTRWLAWSAPSVSPIDGQAPSLTAMTTDRSDVFYNSSPGSVANTPYQRTQASNIWTPESLLASFDGTFAPGCVARGGTKLDCFFVAANGAISRVTNFGSGFGFPSTLTANAASSVSAVAPTTTSVTFAYLDAAGNLVAHDGADSGLGGTPVVVGKPAGMTLLDAPGCTMRRPLLGSAVLDCFARTSNNTLAMITRSASGWGSWSFVPNAKPRSAPSAVSFVGGNDVFFRGADNALVHMERAGSTWTTEYLGGALASAPSCAARTSPKRIDCVARGFRTIPHDIMLFSYQDSLGWHLPRQLGTGLANLALHKAATQVSEYTPDPGPASNAVDGSVDGIYGHGSVTHTNASAGAWWQVDLGATRSIDHLQVINRSDSSPARLNGFVVKLSTNGTTWFDPSGPGDLSLADRTASVYPGTFIPVKNGARYVRIQLPGTQYLSLAEVMVMGKEQQ